MALFSIDSSFITGASIRKRRDVQTWLGYFSFFFFCFFFFISFCLLLCNSALLNCKSNSFSVKMKLNNKQKIRSYVSVFTWIKLTKQVHNKHLMNTIKYAFIVNLYFHTTYIRTFQRSIKNYKSRIFSCRFRWHFGWKIRF